MTMKRWRWANTLTVLVCGLVFTPLSANAFPDRPIIVVVPYGAGGGSDVTARIVVNKISQSIGQPVIIEIVPGANGVVGARRVARSSPDGYVLLYCDATLFTVNPVLMKDAGYLYDDFRPVSLTVRSGGFVVTSREVPVSNLAELRSYLAVKQNKPAFGVVGIGSTPYLALVRLRWQAGLEIQEIPYQGAPQLMTDLLTGRIQMTFLSASMVMPHIKSGALKAIGYSAMARSPLAPDIPTFDEQGLTNFVAGVQYGFLAPKGTPTQIVDQLQKEIVKALKIPEVENRFRTVDYEPVGNTSKEFDDILRRQIPQMKELITVSGIAKM